ncbi:MAG: hypothetical protein QF632_04985 [Candidatus Woesearchaeota archaeon]|jgi:hypothetical protein|nr:hypothetical protein [Candidatus Woesearchaeota archaeon]MDP7324085.1 hypothetical protein [Candidatus Woesearchaeota archaeon]MDP7457994.1 hypothetical protein [Candidatus Woesearchaeota archaeon]|tara:strand:- start:331 stop:702 length:372 start_codon:yes stop_codon:yes gene_type:complete
MVKKILFQKRGVKMSKRKKKGKGIEFDIIVKKKVLGEAPQEYHFVLNDGRRLKSIYDLIDSLEDMANDTFDHHVSEMKNDFATWVNDIFDEKSLSKELKKIHEKLETQRTLLNHMVKELRKIK